MLAAVYTQGTYTPPSGAESAPARTACLLAAVLLHAAAAAWVFEGDRQDAAPARTPPAPVMVELIAPPAPPTVQPPPPAPQPPATAKPKIEPPKLKPKRVERPAPRPPVISRPAEQPAAAAPAVAETPRPPAEPAPAAPPVQAAPAQPAPAPAPVSPPKFNADYLNNPAPAYPSASRSQSEQGVVVLRVLVDASGAAERVELRKSSGHERLDESARDTVKRWRFVPARQGDQAVSAWVLVPISFSLEG